MSTIISNFIETIYIHNYRQFIIKRIKTRYGFKISVQIRVILKCLFTIIILGVVPFQMIGITNSLNTKHKIDFSIMFTTPHQLYNLSCHIVI